MQPLDQFARAIARHAPADGTWDCLIPGVRLIRASQPTMPMPVIYEPTMCFVAQGRKRALLGDMTYVYDAASYLVASVGLPVIGSVIEASEAAPYLCLQLDLDRGELGEVAAAHPRSASTSQGDEQGLTLGRTTPALLDCVVRLVGLLDSPDDIDALAPLITREILYRLLTGPDGGVIRSMTQADSRLNQIARAILWIREHFREAYRIKDAADVAHMSLSSFHQHFKAITGMSPLEFRTHLRLQEARRLMVAEARDAASAGFEVGYGSPSQFSRDYARLFGAPPATHAAQLRGDAAGPAAP
ncbi:MAG: AraC family transcriptional regulator [Hyphomonadaceae bacterium]|nr:AraC family transcriptional regulator [Hyphomonadaceae bacterium]